MPVIFRSRSDHCCGGDRVSVLIVCPDLPSRLCHTGYRLIKLLNQAHSRRRPGLFPVDWRRSLAISGAKLPFIERFECCTAADLGRHRRTRRGAYDHVGLTRDCQKDLDGSRMPIQNSEFSGDSGHPSAGKDKSLLDHSALLLHADPRGAEGDDNSIFGGLIGHRLQRLSIRSDDPRHERPIRVVVFDLDVRTHSKV